MVRQVLQQLTQALPYRREYRNKKLLSMNHLKKGLHSQNTPFMTKAANSRPVRNTADAGQYQEHCSATRSNSFRYGRRITPSRPSCSTRIRENRKKNRYGGEDSPAKTAQKSDMQTLQKFHHARPQLPHKAKTTKGTAHRNHMSQLRKTNTNPNFQKKRWPRSRVD